MYSSIAVVWGILLWLTVLVPFAPGGMCFFNKEHMYQLN